MRNNLWILTEERPKKRVIEMILSYFAKKHNCGFFGGELRIIPICNATQQFTFTYEVIGFSCARVDRIFLKTVSGSSSFVDFLVFYQQAEPTQQDIPLYAIEETKTDDKESRNTGVFQRCSKFVYIRNYFPNTQLVMLYALEIEQKKRPSDTYILGTRLLLTMGVDILGKSLDPKVFGPFESLSEIIAFKQSMRMPPAGNVPVTIEQQGDTIYISGRLWKNGGLSHDPNIGQLSIISACIRQFGWTNNIVVTNHGLEQSHIGATNKFIQIANSLNVQLQNLTLPPTVFAPTYWHYERRGEKLATIFLHLVVENFTESYSIFENHAGAEKGYFVTATGNHVPLQKYINRELYKAGDKSQIVHIPDLVLLDIQESEVITIEGKTYANRFRGIRELINYDAFENLYVKPNYPNFHIVRTVVLYGSLNNEIIDVSVGFMLNKQGHLVLGVSAPKLFTRAIRNLLDYWN